MNQDNTLKKILSKKYIAGAIVVIILVSIFGLRSNNNKEIPHFVVSKGDVIQEVLVSGNIKSANFVDLAFEKTGSIQWISKEIGETVYAGETIAYIENGSETANLEDAKAKLKSEQARYEELKNGGRVEEVRVKEIELNQNEQKLLNYYNSIPQTINDAYNKADSAINKYADPLFSNDQGQNPQISFNINDQSSKNEAETFRFKAGTSLKNIGVINDDVLSNASAITKSKDVSENYLKQTKDELLIIQTFLIKASATLNQTTNLSESDLSTYKDNMSTARANLNTSIQSLSELIDNLASQKILVEKSKQELELEKIGATKEVLEQAEASIERARASIKSAESALSKTIMRSPINGIITKQDGKTGEIIQSGIKIVSVMGKNEFEIETNIPESDLSKIKVGNLAKVTLDAFGPEKIIVAEVRDIDPAEKIVDGVSTYKTTLVFKEPTENIRSGMTADIKITTAEKKDVLAIPQKAVFMKENARFVNVIKNDSGIEQREISIGLKGTNGNFEVIEGLEEGEKISLNQNK